MMGGAIQQNRFPKAPLAGKNLPLGGGGLLFFGIDDKLCFAKRLEKNG